MAIAQLTLTWVGWQTTKNLRSLAGKFDLFEVSASHCKSMQVQARPGQTVSQVDPSFQLASTCDSVWPEL